MEASNWNNENISLLRKANVWYTIRNGNWNDPGVWISNAVHKRNLTAPRAGDTVYINHNVTFNYSLGNVVTINNLYVNNPNATLNFATGTYTLYISGDFQCQGTLDQSAGNNGIILGGVNNYINNFISGTTSTILYFSNFTQTILPLTYNNLQLGGPSTLGSPANFIKNLVTDLTVNNIFVGNGILNTNGYNITIGGVASTGTTSVLTN